MRIVTGIPTYNEINFIDRSVEDALAMDYDATVYLDDGSTDGTYEHLLDYSNKHTNIHVFRIENNSVINKGVNRWKILAEYCREFDPDWIMVRAADQEFSFPSRVLLRQRLEEIFDFGKHNMVAFPVVHFWRSPWWFRIDPPWGGSAMGHTSQSCWRNDSGWEFIDAYRDSGMHRGGHRPNKFNKLMRVANINNPAETEMPLPISVLHYGMSSDELIERKLEFQMKTANIINDVRFLKPTSQMPPPRLWNNYNGYKVGYELNIKLVKSYDIWYETEVPDVQMPKIKSLYNVIKKYNIPMAEEYAKIYGR